MNSYRYRVTVEQIADERGQPVDGRSLVFEAACHDEMLGIVDRVREKRVVANANAAAAMVVGLKLFGEVAIAERKDPMFAEVHAALGCFIRALKGRSGPAVTRLKGSAEMEAQAGLRTS